MKRVALGAVTLFCLAFTSLVPSQLSAQNTTEPQAPAASNQAEVKARVEERRKRQSAALNTAASAKVKERCTGAQSKAEQFKNRLPNSYNSFENRFDAYRKKLERISQKAESEGKDVSELKSQVVVLDQKYAAFKTSFDQLKVSAADLTAMDCKAEPNGFKATLDDLRAQLKAMQGSFKEINAYAKETIKPTLQKLKG